MKMKICKFVTNKTKCRGKCCQKKKIFLEKIFSKIIKKYKKK